MPQVTPDAVTQYGPLVIIFTLVAAFAVYYYWKVWPEDRKYQRDLNGAILEQVALSRQALETSNLVIAQNSDELRESRGSHTRIGERLGCLEEKVERHDERAEQISKDTQAIRTKLGA